jgi:hypothetical protein
MDRDAISHRDYSRVTRCADAGGPLPRRPRGDMPFELLTTEEAAHLLRVSISCLRKWRTQGLGPPWRRVGRRIVYRRCDLERWYDLQPGA